MSTRTTWITGGASGIGAALAAACAQRGDRVVVSDINEAGAEKVAAELGAQAEALPLDVTDASAFRTAAESLRSRYGQIDTLFNNAGIGLGGDFRETTLEDWRRVLDVNLYGVIHGIAAVYPEMVARKSGTIVNTASLAGLLPAPGLLAYGVSKHAVVGLSKTLRADASVHGVRVHVLCPGIVDTPILRSQLRSTREEDREATQKISMPLPVARAETIAAATLKGIARNTPIIVTPSAARTIWRLGRYFPGMVFRQAAETARRLARFRERFLQEPAPGRPGTESRPPEFPTG